ncbi:MAG: TonB-dependent receptor [Terracidiphilus sp.]|nr:TonB-dependent receptor [Terracidiphilus sp.]
MRLKFWLALLPAFCLCGQSALLRAQNQKNTGSLAGIVHDPLNAIVAGAKVEVKSHASGASAMQTSNAAGRFAFPALTAGRYDATITVSGFAVALYRDIAITAGRETTLNVTLRIAGATAEVRVTEDDGSGARRIGAAERARSRNVAEMAAEAPGVSLRTNGELATSPVLHGLGEERTRIVVNGATVSSSCPNYMNDPLSYASNARAATVRVLAGLTPVSAGGDSLGGTVAVDSNPAAFADDASHIAAGANASSFYRSNGQTYGGTVNAWASNRNLAASYTGTWALNEDYTNGGGHKVTSTYAQSTDHVVTLSAQGRGNLVEVEAGLHNTPYEGFVNAQMDMTRNWAESVNLHYRRTFGAGSFDARGYWQGAWHSMNVGRDKIAFPMAMWMPMNTHGRDTGYTVALEEQLGKRHTLHVGNELHRFRLDDTWPPVAGASMMMAPNTFVDIDNGRRTRLGTYTELESRWSPTFGTVFGLRNDTVWTNADAVVGYSSMYATDATAFNASSRAHTDAMVDVTAIAHWDATPLVAIEAGFARKNRAPNLYERYAWSKMWMAALMIGWAGDGNAYVGNVALRPESTNTVSGSLRVRGRSSHVWQLKASPYVNLLSGFIDVDTLATKAYGMTTLAKLQFANHAARIYGGDLAGNVTLWDNLRFGQGSLAGTAAWLHGERTDAQTPLYQMMPMHARVNFNEEWRTLVAGVSVEAVDRKKNVDPHRFEQQTAGYALVGVHASYTRGAMEAGFSADNLLNRLYALPLGGVNVDDFQKSMWMDAIHPLTGRGRSASLHVTARF